LNSLKDKYDNDNAEQTFELRKNLESALEAKRKLEQQLKDSIEANHEYLKLRDNFIGERERAVREALADQRQDFEIEKETMMEKQRAEIQWIKEESAKHLEHLSRQHEVIHVAVSVAQQILLQLSSITDTNANAKSLY
jgi:hypothetical protein